MTSLSLSGKSFLTRGWPVVKDGLKYSLVVGGLVWLFARGTSTLAYNWQWYRVPRYLWTWDGGRLILGPLLKGLLVTFQITLVSLVLAMAVALTAALCRLSSSFSARALARGYLELIRNTPLLIQLFFFYFVLAPILNLGSFVSAVLALSLFEGAYASEILRAGILSIDLGQWEAASSLGLTKPATYRYVILPQAIPRILPPLTSQAISLVKDSALVSTIAIYDLTMQGQAIVAETYLTFEIWFTVALIYLIITISLSILVHRMESRFKLRS